MSSAGVLSFTNSMSTATSHKTNYTCFESNTPMLVCAFVYSCTWFPFYYYNHCYVQSEDNSLTHGVHCVGGS